ncbi:MAG: DUF255 domain-containing protein [Verrucomicrobiae bacterium]|nr:DUF255 domain-containing protein [Verrucomicrobiae bacterium]
MRRYFRHAGWIAIVLVVCGALAVWLNRPGESLTWEPYSAKKLIAAGSGGKPVMLEFYADWCDPCHKLAKSTFRDDQVRSAFQDHVRLRVNLTDYESPASRALRQQFGIAGLPTIIFFRTNGTEIVGARILGYVGAEELLKRSGHR